MKLKLPEVGDMKLIERYLIIPRFFRGKFYWKNVTSMYVYERYQQVVEECVPSLSPTARTVYEWRLKEMNV